MSNKICAFCSGPLTTRDSKKFCSHSCSAKFTNSRRKHNPQTKDKISNAIKAYYINYNAKQTKFGRYCNINYLSCQNCNKTFIAKLPKKKYCSEECKCQGKGNKLRSKTKINQKSNSVKCTSKPNKKEFPIPRSNYVKPYTPIKICSKCKSYTTNINGKYCNNCHNNIRHYRSRAKFNFNVYDYPKEFNLELVDLYGWYSSNGYQRRNKQPNLEGVSRDHLYSVYDGFHNNVPPEYLGHPANCAIIKHNGKGGNNQKHSHSSITLSELYKRIKSWNEKYFSRGQ